MNSLIELFHYRFFVTALLTAVLASISCGIVGTYIVSKRKVFISDGITHASFGGIGIAFYMGINPIVGAVIFAIISALGIEFISKKGDIREDSAIGMIWSLGMALGIIFIFITPNYAPNLMSFLFGNILTVTSTEVLLMFALTAIISLFFYFFYKTILFIAFDEEYARTHRLPVQMFNYLMIALIALCIVLNIRTTGIILVLSFLTIPQSTANIFTRNFSSIIFYSICFGIAGSVMGLLLSYYFNIPSGACIIFVFVIVFICAKVLKMFCTKLLKSK